MSKFWFSVVAQISFLSAHIRMRNELKSPKTEINNAFFQPSYNVTYVNSHAAKS